MGHRCLAAGSTTSLAAGLTTCLAASSAPSLHKPRHRRPTAAACRAAALLIRATTRAARSRTASCSATGSRGSTGSVAAASGSGPTAGIGPGAARRGWHSRPALTARGIGATGRSRVARSESGCAAVSIAHGSGDRSLTAGPEATAFGTAAAAAQNGVAALA